MQSSPLQKTEAKPNPWATFLAFAVGAFALFHERAAIIALLAIGGGFAMLFVRLRQHRDDADARIGLIEELDRARELLERGAHRHALSIAHRAAELAQSARLQREALEIVAWCQLGLGRPERARAALSWLGGSNAIDGYCSAAVEDACGQSLWALHLIERAAKKRPLSREATLFRIDLCARLRGPEAACALTMNELGRLKLEDAERVLHFAREAGCSSAIEALTRAMAEPWAPQLA